MAITIDGSNGISDVRSTTDGSASTPAIRGTDANTGIFFPTADTIAFAEGGAEVARFDSSGNLVLNNGLNSSSGVLATQNGMNGIAKAWAFVSGTTPVLGGGFNISSMTYAGSGIYIYNFTTAMPNANYAVVVGSSNFASNADTANNVGGITTTSFQIQHVEATVGSLAATISMAVFSS
jgi:hypothetical protein